MYIVLRSLDGRIARHRRVSAGIFLQLRPHLGRLLPAFLAGMALLCTACDESIRIDPPKFELAKRIDLKELPFNEAEWETNKKPSILGSPNAKRGGWLRWAIQEYPATLRPVGPEASSVFIRFVGDLVWSTLVGIDPITMAWTPGLASHWKIGKDKQTFWFRLNPRARWSDGVEVTSEDVLETYRFLIDPAINDPFNNTYWKKFEEPVILGKYTFKVKAKEKVWRSFLSIGGGMSIYPAHHIKGYHKEFEDRYQFFMMPGTGPYKLHGASLGESIVMARVKNWWGDDDPNNRGQYNFEKLKFVVITERALMFEKFKKYELDWYHILIAKRWATECDFSKVKKGWITKRRIWTHKPQGVSGIAFNMRKWPFKDVRVRKAWAYAYNRKKLIAKLFHKQYFPTDSHYPNSVYENKGNIKIRFSLKKAEDLLAEAGFSKRDEEGWIVDGKGKRLEVTLNIDSSSAERIYTVYQVDLKKVGVKLNLKRTTQATIWKLMHEKKFSITSIAWGGLLFPNPESSVHSKYADKESNNIWGLKDKKIDRLIEEYNVCFGIKRRIEIMQQIDRRLVNHHMYALGWFAPYTRVLYWNKFGMPPYAFSRFSDYRSIVSLWWIDPEKERKLKEVMKKKLTLPVGEVELKFWHEFSDTNGRNWRELNERWSKTASKVNR